MKNFGNFIQKKKNLKKIVWNVWMNKQKNIVSKWKIIGERNRKKKNNNNNKRKYKENENNIKKKLIIIHQNIKKMRKKKN